MPLHEIIINVWIHFVFWDGEMCFLKMHYWVIFKLILDKFSSLFKSLFLSVLHRWAILGNQFVLRSDIFVILWQVSLQVHRGRGLAHWPHRPHWAGRDGLWKQHSGGGLNWGRLKYATDRNSFYQFRRIRVQN